MSERASVSVWEVLFEFLDRRESERGVCLVRVHGESVRLCVYNGTGTVQP